MYKGPGSYWEWCGSCRSYEHMSGYVPISWVVELSGIDHSKLTAIPDMIDIANIKIITSLKYYLISFPGQGKLAKIVRSITFSILTDTPTGD